MRRFRNNFPADLIWIEAHHQVQVTSHRIGNNPCLAYTTYLPEQYDAAPLLLMHGASHTQAIYIAWANVLAASGIPVVTLDLRGHGNSTMPDHRSVATAHIADYVQDIQTVMQSEPILQQGHCVLLGHSLGGAVVQLYAQDHPVDGLIVLAAPSAHRFLPATLRIAARYPILYGHSLWRGARSLFGTAHLVRQFLVEPDADQSVVDEVLAQIGDESTRLLADGLALTHTGMKPVLTDQVLFLGAENDACFAVVDIQRSALDYQTEMVLLPNAPHDLMVAHAPVREQAAAAIAQFCKTPGAILLTDVA